MAEVTKAVALCSRRVAYEHQSLPWPRFLTLGGWSQVHSIALKPRSPIVWLCVSSSRLLRILNAVPWAFPNSCFSVFVRRRPPKGLVPSLVFFGWGLSVRATIP